MKGNTMCVGQPSVREIVCIKPSIHEYQYQNQNNEATKFTGLHFFEFFYIPTKNVQSIFNWVKCCTNAHTTGGHLSNLPLYATCYGKHECKTYKFIIIFLYSTKDKNDDKNVVLLFENYFSYDEAMNQTHAHILIICLCKKYGKTISENGHRMQ